MALISPVLWEPSADEARVRRAADLWGGFAANLECTLGELGDTVRRVSAGQEGAAVDAIGRYWADLAGPDDDDLRDLVEACRSIAAALDAYAEALAETRRQLVELAATIAATIALGAALSLATAGVSAAGAAGAVAATTARAAGLAAVLVSRATTIPRVVALHATIGALEGLASYAVVEPLRIAAFHPNEDPFASYELAEVLTAAAGGAVIPGWRALRSARGAGAARIARSVPAPPPAMLRWGRPAKLDDHVTRHGGPLGAVDAEDYVRKASAFFRRGARGDLPMKVDDDGVMRIFDEASNTFGSFGPDGTVKTFFKPDRPGYWADQKGQLQ